MHVPEDPFEIGLRFAQLVTGTVIVDGPPRADSPLGRMIAEMYGEDALTEDGYAALMREETSGRDT